MTRALRNAAWLSLLVGSLLAPPAARAFVLDSHYYLTFGLALGTCFDWDEAHIIASGNFMLDRNKTTKAEANFLKVRNKRIWHAFGHDDERLNILWARALEETDPDLRLMKFGQALHFIMDWEGTVNLGPRR